VLEFRRMSSYGVVLGLLLADIAAASPPPAGSAGAFAPMTFLIGTWSCSGVFPASGRTIASTISFASDLDGAAIVKHHDDVAPGPYRAVETWVYNPANRQYAAAIADNFGGVREFDSRGWNGDVLVWSSAAGVKPDQEFAYTKISDDRFKLDWRVSRDGTAYAVGDTLTCARAKPSA